MPGHQRNASQGQHLIVDRHESGDEEDLERQVPAHAPPEVSTGGVFPTSQPNLPISRPHENKIKGGCRDPRLRSNYKVVIGSILLTAIGSTLLVYGALVFFEISTDHAGVQAWMLVFAGLLCFVPGFYHVYYITCTLCGRPGFSLDKLPTFSR
ncbi:unnamed protein product, partial [Mesorhabditis belari]|uniref:Transmembrane protein 230 n=1 Tax=Mesorhabditis belari TaxID=2138241 RepID=A0AAF3F1Z6_9BILA